MSSDAPNNPIAEERLDALLLTSLMSSRLCHDLVNPVGALSSGLDVLNDDDMDAEMRDEALSLIHTSTSKAVALLKFARLAYGLAGGYEHDISFEEAKELLHAVYASTKATLDWQVGDPSAPKEEVKAILLVAHAASDCVPRGGDVVISGARGDYLVTVTGKRLILNDGAPKALGGDTEELTPKFAPLYVAGLLTRETGGGAQAVLSDDDITFRIKFDRREKPDTALTGS